MTNNCATGMKGTSDECIGRSRKPWLSRASSLRAVSRQLDPISPVYVRGFGSVRAWPMLRLLKEVTTYLVGETGYTGSG